MRGDGRVFKRGNRWWVAYYAFDPESGRRKEKREPAGATEKQAEKLLRRRRDEIAVARSEGRPFLGPKAETITVSELLDDLERHYKRTGKKSLPQLHSRMKRIKTAFGMNKAVMVTPTRVDHYIEERLGEGAKKATVNREVEVLQRALTLAVRQQKIAYAPRFTSLDEKDKVRQGFFEKADFHAVLEHIGDADLSDFLEWFFFTGMRNGEIASLTWESYDRETDTVRLPGKEAKTGAPRKLAIVGDLAPIFRRRLKARRLDCPFIFHRDGRRMGEFRKRWKTACEKAGVKGKRPYDLRRTAIRNMSRAGVPENVAMKISGHKTRSTFDRYDITSDDDIRRAMEATSDYVSNLPMDRTVVPIDDAKHGTK